jgi:hypothetical protein
MIVLTENPKTFTYTLLKFTNEFSKTDINIDELASTFM